MRSSLLTVSRRLNDTVSGRSLSSKSLKDILKDQIPAKQEALKQLKLQYGNRSLGEVTVDQW